MVRAGLVKLESMIRWNDSVFGTFTSDAPEAVLIAAMIKVEEAFGDIGNLAKILESQDYVLVL